MTPERWQEVKKILAGALERTPEQRRAYLDSACSDPDLRREVESLITAQEQGGTTFMVMEQSSTKIGTLKNGTKIGSYTIQAPIGSGGMGEVYRAHDTKLKRDVAIKVLPRAFAKDPERLMRFAREARLLAALNHPNIGSIYGLEDSGDAHALVMELVEGPTLANRISQGPIPLDEALRIAKQICEALEYAHERGIVHRDLKPANIKVSRDDSVKILDFGLAKAVRGEAEQDLVNSPTLSQMATQAGVLLGTAAYMSPEQAKGKPVDRRADIWAFACVVYEMLTGKRAFADETVTETLAAIMRAEPDWKALPAATPMRVRVLLQRCLQKDPKQRLRDIGDARISLEEALSGAPDAAPTGTPEVVVPIWRRALPWALFGTTALGFAAFAWLHGTATRSSFAPPSVHLQIPLPTNPPLRPTGLVALSPDGRKLAFVATGGDGIARIWIRALDSLDMHSLSGTEAVGSLLFWSPDSRHIAFDAAGKLQKIDVSGGPSETVCALARNPVGGTWSQGGVIVFGQFLGPLMQVPAAGGVPTPLTVLDTSHGDLAHTNPWFLPDGRHFIYYRDLAQTGDVSVGSLDAKPQDQDPRKLLQADSGAIYVPMSGGTSGQLLFLRAGILVSQPFDTRRLAPSGEPTAVSNEPIGRIMASGLFTASGAELAYWSMGSVESQPTWFDSQGNVLGTMGDRGQYNGIALSPDGTQAILSKVSLGHSGLWLLDLSRGTTAPFEIDPSFNYFGGVWTPDGRRVVSTSDQTLNSMRVLEKSINGETDVATLMEASAWTIPQSWSPDGRFLLYVSVDGQTKTDLLLLPREGNRKPVPFLRTEFAEDNGAFSPDGHWVAYESNESGRFEIYVRSFMPEALETGASKGAKWLLSNNGGNNPMWRQDGKQLFYIDPDRKLMAVDVTTQPVFRAGVPRLLFQAPRRIETLYDIFMPQWVPSPDGKRFLFLVPEAQGAVPFTVVLNWQAGLKN